MSRQPEKPARATADATLGDVLTAFRIAGAHIGAQAGALAIKAYHGAKVGPQPVLYWRLAEAPKEVRELIPPDGSARDHVVLVPLGVEPPGWCANLAGPDQPAAPLHLRMADGTHLWVF